MSGFVVLKVNFKSTQQVNNRTTRISIETTYYQHHVLTIAAASTISTKKQGIRLHERILKILA